MRVAEAEIETIKNEMMKHEDLYNECQKRENVLITTCEELKMVVKEKEVG